MNFCVIFWCIIYRDFLFVAMSVEKPILQKELMLLMWFHSLLTLGLKQYTYRKIQCMSDLTLEIVGQKVKCQQFPVIFIFILYFFVSQYEPAKNGANIFYNKMVLINMFFNLSNGEVSQISECHNVLLQNIFINCDNYLSFYNSFYIWLTYCTFLH